jgi:hypothetical protein
MQAAAAPRDYDRVFFYYHARKLAIISGSRFLKIRVESRFSFPMVDIIELPRGIVCSGYIISTVGAIFILYIAGEAQVAGVLCTFALRLTTSSHFELVVKRKANVYTPPAI